MAATQRCVAALIFLMSMKQCIVVVLLSICMQLYACTGSENSLPPTDTIRNEKSLLKDTLPLRLADIHRLWINDTLALISPTHSSIPSFLGSPLKVEMPQDDEVCVSYFDGKFEFVYYPNILFEKYTDSLICREINFRQGLYLRTPGGILNSTTTESDFLKQFVPLEKDTHRLGLAMKIWSVRASVLHPDDLWFFTFRNGKLVKLEYWMPC